MFFAPFLAFYAIVFFLVLAFFFILLEIHVISYAFVTLGLPPELAFTALLVSLVGSYTCWRERGTAGAAFKLCIAMTGSYNGSEMEPSPESRDDSNSFDQESP